MYPEEMHMGMPKHSRVTLCSEDLPEVAEWATGGEYVVVLHLKQVRSELEGEDTVEAHFEVCNAKVAPAKYAKSIIESVKGGDLNG